MSLKKYNIKNFGLSSIDKILDLPHFLTRANKGYKEEGKQSASRDCEFHSKSEIETELCSRVEQKRKKKRRRSRVPCWRSQGSSYDVMSALTFGQATSLCKNNFCGTPCFRSQFLYFLMFSVKPFFGRSSSTQSNVLLLVESQTKLIDDMHSKKAKKRQTTWITQKVIPGTNRVAKMLLQNSKFKFVIGWPGVRDGSLGKFFSSPKCQKVCLSLVVLIVETYMKGN